MDGISSLCPNGTVCDKASDTCIPKLVASFILADDYADSGFECLTGGQCPPGYTCNFATNFCEKGSGSGSNQNCKDKKRLGSQVSDCPSRHYLCKDPLYKDVMVDQCPKTCDLCGKRGRPKPGCVDKAGADCAALKYLCTEAHYKVLMAEQCAITCEKC
ncbi:hypothetical protein L596_022618 [Steinernema carpocapsae]|uniref:ShKT domain-containing protein n=1 Tax=Steinernema carpocapsae TaxID=34508 RepID=A0A4V6A099_STECR|nr:hypothetical protein L596_022618 [Steinernema carpocapsae]